MSDRAVLAQCRSHPFASPQPRGLRSQPSPRPRSGAASAPRRSDPVAWLDGHLGHSGDSQVIRPLVVGIVHGLAGSAAVALLVLTTIRNPQWSMVYLLIFRLGTLVGHDAANSTDCCPLRHYLAAVRPVPRPSGSPRDCSALAIRVPSFLYQTGCRKRPLERKPASDAALIPFSAARTILKITLDVDRLVSEGRDHRGRVCCDSRAGHRRRPALRGLNLSLALPVCWRRLAGSSRSFARRPPPPLPDCRLEAAGIRCRRDTSAIGALSWPDPPPGRSLTVLGGILICTDGRIGWLPRGHRHLCRSGNRRTGRNAGRDGGRSAFPPVLAPPPTITTPATSW